MKKTKSHNLKLLLSFLLESVLLRMRVHPILTKCDLLYSNFFNDREPIHSYQIVRGLASTVEYFIYTCHKQVTNKLKATVIMDNQQIPNNIRLMSANICHRRRLFTVQ